MPNIGTSRREALYKIEQKALRWRTGVIGWSSARFASMATDVRQASIRRRSFWMTSTPETRVSANGRVRREGIIRYIKIQ
jgi:hypothetical protein